MAPGALEIAAEATFGAWALAASAVAIVTSDGRRRSLALASAFAASSALAASGGSIVTGAALLALAFVTAALVPVGTRIRSMVRRDPALDRGRPARRRSDSRACGRDARGPSSLLSVALAVPTSVLLVVAAVCALRSARAQGGESLVSLYAAAPLAVVAAGVVLLVALVAVAARPSGEAR